MPRTSDREAAAWAVEVDNVADELAEEVRRLRAVAALLRKAAPGSDGHGELVQLAERVLHDEPVTFPLQSADLRRPELLS